MNKSLVTSITAFLSILMPTLALDGYTCLGENVSHHLLMSHVDTSYNTCVAQDPLNPFFFNSNLQADLDFGFTFPGYNGG